MKHRLLNTLLIVIGFILSPLSWWNDLLVNLPLSYLLSWPFSLVDERLFLPAFIGAYWLSNLAGFVLMHLGVYHLLPRQRETFSMRNSVLVSLAYTLLIVLLVWQGWLVSPIELMACIQSSGR
jgi:hypothetical protein